MRKEDFVFVLDIGEDNRVTNKYYGGKDTKKKWNL